MRVLLEMRPALDGHAGLPQATRLLFRGLSQIEGVDVEGLIQSSHRVLSKGLPAQGARLSADREINRLSRLVISLQKDMYFPVWAGTKMVLWHLLGGSQKLTRFESRHFRDFVWRSFFSRTLPFEDFDLVTRSDFRVARVPWTAMHRAALLTRKLGAALYPRLDTSGFDIMIAETPYPARLAPGTRLVVRYHDAIPVLMPHTISDKRYHQASHYWALRNNVNSDAWFACVSEATRKDLLAMFPQAERRAVTIPNIVSHHYYREPSDAARIPEIVNTRLHHRIKKFAPVQARLSPKADADGRGIVEYLLMVSTIEPRKNHAALLAAWEQLKAADFPNLKLVVVGALGWSYKPIVRLFRPWMERGDLFALEDVPAPELRMLYTHAKVTVCPSFGEGFDFSGVEAMRCGCPVVASDIAVHREIFGNAAEFFNAYSVEGLIQAIVSVAGAGAQARRQELVDNGAQVSAQYSYERILPKWNAFLRSSVKGAARS